MLCYAGLCYAVLCCAVLCCAVLYALLCYATLCLASAGPGGRHADPRAGRDINAGRAYVAQLVGQTGVVTRELCSYAMLCSTQELVPQTQGAKAADGTALDAADHEPRGKANTSTC